jgi:hypothetical protein
MLGGYCRGQPRGSPKTTGKILLKACKKPKRNTSHLNTHTGRGPHCGGLRDPPEWPTQRPPRAGSASLEGSHFPRAGSASLEGSRPPRAGSASLEGSPPPRLRLPCTHAHSRTRVRTFNALARQGGTIMCLGIMPRSCCTNSPGGTHPTEGDCATWPVSAPCHCAAYSRTPNAPRPRRGVGHTLEALSRELAGPGHAVRPAGRHPRHRWSCAAVPVLATPRRALLQPLRRREARGNGMPPRLPL